MVIEIDGVHHLQKENIEQDRHRDAYLNELGLRVLRFTNLQIKKNFPWVIEKILRGVQEKNDGKTFVHSTTHFDEGGRREGTEWC